MCRCDGSFLNNFFHFASVILNFFSRHISDELCEREIEVDGEPATVTLMDTWDVEVRWCIRAADARSNGCT